MMPVAQLDSILVATMLDARSTVALVRAATMALAFGARLYVVHVLPSGAVPLIAPARETVRRWVVRATGLELSDASILIRASNDRGAVIREIASEVDADLIVTGRQSPHSMRSSTIETLADPLEHPLLVADEPRDTRRIVAATDFRHPAFPVVMPAAELAEQLSAEITVVHNIEPVGPLITFKLETPSVTATPSEMVLTVPSDLLAWRGYTRSRVSNDAGDAPRSTALAIGSLSRDQDADLIVVGVRPQHGRTFTNLLATCGRSILALPLPAPPYAA